MQEYQPPFTISNKMLKYVSSISEKIGKINNHSFLDAKPHLRRNNRIKSIHSSLKIEANSLSLSEVRDVINGKIVIGDKQEIQEVKNAYLAYKEITKIDPYSINDLTRIHGIMTAGLIHESGDFRKGQEGVFSGNKCIFVAPPPNIVPSLIENLFDWMQKNRNVVHPLIMSAVFHYEFVFIHPFTDGNGRMARLWHTVLLYQWRNIFEYIPLESQIEKFQHEYYEAISKCHENGDSNEFIEFILFQIDKTIDDLIKQFNKSNSELSEYVKRMLDVMEYDIPYTTKAIMEKLGLKSRETFRKNYMNPALKLGVVEMTIPDKPNSKNQRYIKK